MRADPKKHHTILVELFSRLKNMQLYSRLPFFLFYTFLIKNSRFKYNLSSHESMKMEYALAIEV